MSEAAPPRVLMIYPRFNAESFWNFREACELVGARYPAAPLGLITLAAMLPPSWDIRLVNRNTEELTDDDLAWADLVMTGGMLFQQPDTLRLIGMCKKLGKPVAVGGPDITSSPHVYKSADFVVAGEAEGILDQFVAAWEAGQRSGTFEAEKFQADVTKSPVPRFDLLKFDHYLYVGVQFSRGCPFTCEFCDIIELYGRVPRTKTTPQMLAELDRLYELGYRGHVDFVDDNLIGNKKAIKAFLPHLIDWLKAHDYPFEFTTEASVNLADDDELLRLLGEANFFGVFVGIESPDPETLVAMRKKQNTRRNLVESIHRIYAAGLFVTAGFIVGFDNEKAAMAEVMNEFIAEASIPVCMMGLLYALPNTQLSRRLAKEGRLHPDHDLLPSDSGDHCVRSLNFDTLRARADVLRDYRQVLSTTYEPNNFAKRLEGLATMLKRPTRRRELHAGDVRGKLPSIDALYRIVNALPEAKQAFWRVFTRCAKENPDALRYVMYLMAFYLHLGPYSGHVVREMDRQIAELELEMTATPSMNADVAAMPLAAAV